MRNDLILQNEPGAEDQAEDHDFSIADNGIPKGFERMLLASIRQIAMTAFIPPTTVFHRLTKSLCFVLKQLPWVPYRLSDLQNQARVIMPKESLKLLDSMRYHSWKDIVTLDVAWFDLFIDHEPIWLSPEDEAPQREGISKNDAEGRVEPTRISLA
jgi:hypothetical protein